MEVPFIQECDIDSELHINAAKGLLEECINIIKHDKDTNESDFFGWTPIMYAARNGHLHIVKLLYEHGGIFTIKNRYGLSPLSLAIANGNEEVVRYILDEMLISQKKQLEEDRNSFGLASFLGKTTLVKLFLSLNLSNVNEPVLCGLTPLLLAVTNGKKRTARALLIEGANKSEVNFQSQTCYDIAIYQRDTKMQALFSDSKFYTSPLSPLTPLNNQMSFSPLAIFAVPNVTRQIFPSNKLDFNESQNIPTSSNFSGQQQCLNRDNNFHENEEHSYCKCHYLNGLLSPRIVHQKKLHFHKRGGDTEERKKLIYFTSKQDKKGLSWVKKKLFKSLYKRNENDRNVCNKIKVKDNYRMRENLKITQILTTLELEEYISTFILQEIDADSITTLTKEDLINVGIHPDKCDEILQKIAMLI